MNAVKKFGLLLTSIVLLYLSWPPSQFGPLVFIAFVPLFFYFDSVFKTDNLKRRYLLSFAGLFFVLYAFIYFTSFDAWGEYDASIAEFALMSALPKAVIVSMFALIRNRKWSFFFLILAWASVEILQTHWEFNAPFFMLGNSMSGWPSLIQHYSVWGILGGTMHILAINVLFFYLIVRIKSKENKKMIVVMLALNSIPILISPVMYSNNEMGEKHKVAIAVGNFDHFKLEYSENPKLLIDQYNTLLKDVPLDEVELVILPESAVVNGGWVENLNNSTVANPLDSLCPGKEIFLGSHLFSLYHGDENENYNVRRVENSDVFYVSHNCIVFRNKLGQYKIRSKEKLVPFHEFIPYPSIFQVFENWFQEGNNPTYLSSYASSHNEPFSTQDRLKISALMCFESSFSDMTTRNPDADLVLVLANESWNYELKGKEQYLTYLRAKAIESGKNILKVSNGGQTGFINSSGRLVFQRGFDKPIAEVVEIHSDAGSSIYSALQGGISNGIVFCSILCFFVLFIRQKLQQKRN